MPAVLSRKRRVDSIELCPEKRRRVSSTSKTTQQSPQESIRVEVHRERNNGSWDWHAASSFYPIESLQCSAHIRSNQGTATRDVQIGRCSALFVERERLRHNFQTRMKQHGNDTALLASALFDETGCLKSEFTNRALKSGSGLWNYELNDGDLIIIQRIEVSSSHQSGNVTSMLLDRMLQEGSRRCRGPFFAFALGAQTPEIDSNLFMDAVDLKGRPVRNGDYFLESIKTREVFWRSMGFRRAGMTPWFAWSSDPEHPSRYCLSWADFDLTARHFFSEHNQHGLIHADILKDLSDDHCVRLFQQEGTNVFVEDLRRIDANGNTLIHLAALSSKPLFLSWLIHSCPTEVKAWRNFDRETPLESLLSARSTQRKMLDDHSTLTFKGHCDASLDCQRRLCDLHCISTEILQKWKFDCTCMHCIGGFLSPRSQIKLISAARMPADIHSASWFAQRMLADSKNFDPIIEHDLMQLFQMCMEQIAGLLTTSGLPTVDSVFLHLISHLDLSLSQSMAEFILNSGVVESAIAAAVNLASSMTGFAEARGNLAQNHPKCRNDDDWTLVRGQLIITAELQQ